ncbi:hypothetical protein Pint_10449 [Pistacia integerrima]|uniref:Uncharacterized protein n=1 Tax=Pistacia integerrima TaxID=434235 RepID=A0ACC0XEN0_9ROSI|nr:hypothetical protein Pint_10449 [Pistacia integerrima]
MRLRKFVSTVVEELFPMMPHFFALGYLGVKDLLSVERVCRITDIGLKRVLESNPGMKKIRMETPSGIIDSIPAWIKFFVQALGEIPYNGIYYDPLEEVWFCNLLFL